MFSVSGSTKKNLQYFLLLIKDNINPTSRFIQSGFQIHSISKLIPEANYEKI